MASIAEQLIGGAQRTAEKVGEGTGDAMIQLGQRIEKTKADRAALEQKKAALQNQKISRFASAVESGSRLKDKSAQNSYFKNFLPKLRAGLGLDDVFSDESLQMIGGSPDLQQKFAVLRSKITRGEMTTEEAIGTINDPEKLAEMSADKLLQAEQFSLTTAAQLAKSQAQLAETQASRGQRKEQFETGQERIEMKRVDDNVQKLSKGLKDSKINERKEVFQQIKDFFPDANIKSIYDLPDDTPMPGFGLKDGKLPDALVGPKATKFRALVKSVRNAALQAGGGKALTESEQKLFNDVLGVNSGWNSLKTRAQLVQGLKLAKKILDVQEAEITSTFDEPTKAEARKRGVLGEAPTQDQAQAKEAVPINTGNVTMEMFEKFDDKTKKEFLAASKAPNMKALKKALEGK